MVVAVMLFPEAVTATFAAGAPLAETVPVRKALALAALTGCTLRKPIASSIAESLACIGIDNRLSLSNRQGGAERAATGSLEE
jgi:hypothetical protein